METYLTQRKAAVLQPRLISVSGYQGLFDEALQTSIIRKRADNTDEEIRLLKEEIVRLKATD